MNASAVDLDAEERMGRKGQTPEPEKPDPERKPVGLSMKASPEWTDWLRRAAEHSGLSVSVFIDQAARRYARFHGFDEAPPKR